MQFILNDGGRAAAGFKGTAGDCVCRSIAIATGKDYLAVYDALNALAAKERIRRPKRGGRARTRSSARTGVHKPTINRYLRSIGWTFVPTMTIGSGCTVHLADGELPMGRLIVNVSRHMVAVIDGVIHDTHDPSRQGSRCVYGYWKKPGFNAGVWAQNNRGE